MIRLADILKRTHKIDPADLAIAVAVIVDDRRRVLVVRRSEEETNRALEWETPGGHINEGEKPEDAAIRETKEETGLDITIVPHRRIYFSTKDGKYGVMLLAHPIHKQVDLKRDEHDKAFWVPLSKLDRVRPVPPDFHREVKALLARRKSNLLSSAPGESLMARSRSARPATDREPSRTTLEKLNEVDPVDFSIDEPSSNALWNLDSVEKPDYDHYEEVRPASLDEIMSHPPDRPAGRNNFNKNDRGVDVNRTIRDAIHQSGAEEVTACTKLSRIKTSIAFTDPRKIKSVSRRVLKAGLLAKTVGSHRLVVSSPVVAFIKPNGSKWEVESRKGKSLGMYPTRERAQERLHQVEYFARRSAARRSTVAPVTLPALHPTSQGYKASRRASNITGRILPETDRKVNSSLARKAVAPVTLPVLQSTDPTKSLTQQLGPGLVTKPGTNGQPALTTNNPAQTLQKAGQLIQQGKIAPGQAATTPTTTPMTPTQAMTVASRLWAKKPWFRGVTASARGLQVRVASCGCDGGDQDSGMNLGGIPIRLIFVTPKNGESSEKNENKHDGVETAEGHTDPDSGEVTAAGQKKPDPPLSRKLQFEPNPEFEQGVKNAQKKLDALRADPKATPEQIEHAEIRVKRTQMELNTHNKILQKYRRDPRYTTLKGLADVTQEELDKQGGKDEYKHWYERHKPLVEERIGGDRSWGGGPDLFYKCLAATSPNTKVDANVKKAWDAYAQIKTFHENGTKPNFGNFQAHAQNLHRVFEGGDVQGPKVKPFQDTLTGKENPEVVIDVWMARALFGVDKPSPAQIRSGQKIITKVATIVGVNPSSTQALLWDHIRDRFGYKPVDFVGAIRKTVPAPEAKRQQEMKFAGRRLRRHTADRQA